MLRVATLSPPHYHHAINTLSARQQQAGVVKCNGTGVQEEMKAAEAAVRSKMGDEPLPAYVYSEMVRLGCEVPYGLDAVRSLLCMHVCRERGEKESERR